MSPFNSFTLLIGNKPVKAVPVDTESRPESRKRNACPSPQQQARAGKRL